MGTCTVTYGNSSWTEDVSGSVSVKYNDIEIASVAPGSSKTLYCLGDLMRGKLKIGNKVLNCLKKIMQHDVVIEVEKDALIPYFFDSSRTDNFIFGKYNYTMSSGAVVPNGQTSWPYSSDSNNNSASKIVLLGQESGLLKPSAGNDGYTNAVLELHPQGGTQFYNNVEWNGYQPQYAYVGNNVTWNVYVKGYKTDSGENPKVSYLNSSGTVLASMNITGYDSAVYSMQITTTSGGYFKFEAATGCGMCIIKDFWLEEVK